MLKVLRNNRGMSITEVIMSLAILGIILIPLMVVFSNSVFITKLTGDQMELNAVMQIAKGEVIQSVKNNNKLIEFANPANEIRISPAALPRDSLYSASGNETVSLELQSGNLTSKYKYKVKFIDKGKDILGPIDSTETLEPRTVELIIKLYSAYDKYLSELKVHISY